MYRYKYNDFYIIAREHILYHGRLGRGYILNLLYKSVNRPVYHCTMYIH